MSEISISSLQIISTSLSERILSIIKEYEAIKEKRSNDFKYVKDLCKHHKISHQNFMRIYRRYQLAPVPTSLVPQKRGPKFKTRRTDLAIEAMVQKLRLEGKNRYDIVDSLQRSDNIKISATTVYNICCRYGLNRLTPKIKQDRRKIMVKKIGELGHLDCYQLHRGITIKNSTETYYLLGLIDDYSRLA